MPILLRRNDTGQWTVDEAGMAAQFHLYDLGINPVPKYERSPYAFAWRETEHRKIVHSLYGERSATPATVPARR